MMRVRVTVAGWAGGPGLQTFYFTDSVEGVAEAGHCVTRVRSALASVSSIFPNSVTLQVQPIVDIMDPANGEISASHSAAPVAVLNGTGGTGNTLPPATAFVIRLQTSTYNAGRRLQGRLFLSPLVTTFSDATGKPVGEPAGAGQAFSDVLNDTGITSPLPVIWRRPREAKPEAVPPVPFRPGSTGRITSGGAKPTFGVLRSRRD